MLKKTKASATESGLFLWSCKCHNPIQSKPAGRKNSGKNSGQALGVSEVGHASRAWQEAGPHPPSLLVHKGRLSQFANMPIGLGPGLHGPSLRVATPSVPRRQQPHMSNTIRIGGGQSNHNLKMRGRKCNTQRARLAYTLPPTYKNTHKCSVYKHNPEDCTHSEEQEEPARRVC